MTIKTLTKEVERLRKRVSILEKSRSKRQSLPHKKQTAEKPAGLVILQSVYGVWSKKSRTEKDLAVIRKRLWN